MKRNMLKGMILAVLLASTGMLQAQNVGNILKNAASALASGNSENPQSGSAVQGVVSGLLDGLIGTGTVKAETLAGTWNYEKPAVAFESSNLLKKAGASVMANTIENKLQTYLTKIGFTAGKASFTFTQEGEFTMNLKGKSVTGTYTVEGSTITFQRKSLLNTKPMTANVKVVGKEMQITFKADKLLNFITNFASGSSITGLQTVGKLAEGIDGMQLGFKFSK